MLHKLQFSSRREYVKSTAARPEPTVTGAKRKGKGQQLIAQGNALGNNKNKTKGAL